MESTFPFVILELLAGEVSLLFVPACVDWTDLYILEFQLLPMFFSWAGDLDLSLPAGNLVDLDTKGDLDLTGVLLVLFYTG